MAMRRRNTRADLAWLKWWLVLLGLCLAIAIGGYWSALYYRTEMSRLELGTRSNFDVIIQEVTQIEESERIIVENIDRYNELVRYQIMGTEDRVSLLEDISRIRNRFLLYPIDVEVSERSQRVLEYGEEIEIPEEQIVMHSSFVRLRIPLLHEEDLTRFLNAFLNAGRLMVTTSCAINSSETSASISLELIERQIADCEFIWYTFSQEMPSLGEEYDEFIE